MSDQFVVLFLLMLVAVTAYGVVVVALTRRGQRKYLREHPELSNSFGERHTPAE